jgi:dipeptidyl aminopeptidase/acylaminoacyl peptidase
MRRTAFLLATLAALATLVALAAPAVAAPKRGLTIDDMLAMQRIGEPAVSPDGTMVAYSVRETDLEANRGRFDLWLAATDGSWGKRLTTHPENDNAPAWSADGKAILFLSTRSGSSQVWRIAPGGGEAQQLTKLPLDVNGFRPFPDGRLLLAIDVWPEAKTLAASVAKDEATAKAADGARAYDQLLFRHWDTWEDHRYSHLFVWTPPAMGGKADDARDLTPGLATDAPPHPFGGMEETAISPDGKQVAYVARVGGRAIAWTTNTDVFLVPTAGGKPTNLTVAAKGYENQPTFSPDGRTLAYLSMARAGYEADRQRITLLDLASRKARIVADAWDRSASSIAFAPDGRAIFTSADDVGNHALFRVDLADGKVTTLVARGTNASPQPAAGGKVVFLRDTLTSPAELYAVDGAGGAPKAITTMNAGRVAQIAWGAYEQFSFKGARGDTVHGYAMKPANHAGGKAPVAFLIHGGPQGSFGDHFHYRWNPEVFAGAGYGVVFIDFHGSTGYGQAFTDAIRGDWGGAPYEDLMKGLDAALARFPWLDGARVAGLGASYGGYMINWINGNTDRFKALVCHDGNLDERMAYFDTEELWFPEWEHGGVPWDAKAGYGKHNPIDKVSSWKTPTLVIHGGRDYRVVDTQGLSTFTALQRKGVPSRLVYFEGENHWVLKPKATRRWHREVLDWIGRYTRGR